MDNDSCPKYPGLGLPIEYDIEDGDEYYPMASRPALMVQTNPIPAREVAMMIVMDRLTDKKDWHTKIFDDDIVAKWRVEAEASDTELWKEVTEYESSLKDTIIKENKGYHQQRRDFTQKEIDNVVGPLSILMDAPTFDACVQELRAKAKYWEQSGLIPTLDAYASVVKSDSIIDAELQQELQAAFSRLQADQAACPDWHPGTDNKVQNLVHPSMYPLVYGRSGAFQNEVVGIHDAIGKWAGKWDTMTERRDLPPGTRERWDNFWGAETRKDPFISTTYQWLPANLSIQPDGNVRFTSYINNLHPTKYADIYGTIEKVISRALPAWDQCLAHVVRWGTKLGVGRTGTRFDINDRDDYGKDVLHLNRNKWHLIPQDKKQLGGSESDISVSGSDSGDESGSEYDDDKFLKVPLQPRPNRMEECEREGYYSPKHGMRLVDRFQDKGLQVHVKMVSMELTPDKPEFTAGSWHVEGQTNENICATALYYLDSENITEPGLSFRMQTYGAYQNDEPGFDPSQGGFTWMNMVYGTEFGGGSAPGVQNYGSVHTREGRLVAFPNIFQHRVHPFRLADPTKPGRRRFIALWLVDPHLRIISTANVAPQQRDWWFDATLGETISTRKETLKKLPAELSNLMVANGALSINSGGQGGEADEGETEHVLPTRLPNELMDMVRSHISVGSSDGNDVKDGEGEQSEKTKTTTAAANNFMLPMSREEAMAHREKLMEGRTSYNDECEDAWLANTYNFCEH